MAHSEQYVQSLLWQALEEKERRDKAQVFLRVFDTEDGSFVIEELKKQAGLHGEYFEALKPSDPKGRMPINTQELWALEGARRMVWLIEMLRDYNRTLLDHKEQRKGKQ